MTTQPGGTMPHHSAGRARLAGRALSAAILCMGVFALVDSLSWRGASFPGFFLMPNRVVPSAGLPSWSGVADGAPPYQDVLLAVDGVTVVSGADGYRRAAAHRVGEPVQYLFAHRGSLETRPFPLRVFTDAEWIAVFGMYLLTGAAFLFLAVLANSRWSDGEPYRGLAAFGWVSAAFAFSGMDLYGPGMMFRIHVLAEATLPAAAVHLACVCPRNQLHGRPGVLPLVYGLALTLAAVYELFLAQPGAYSAFHNFAQALSAVPVLVLTTRVALALGEPLPMLAARGVPVFLVGAFGGIVAPGLVLGISGLSGGTVPVNVSAWTGFLFPVCAVAAFRLVPGPLASFARPFRGPAPAA